MRLLWPLVATIVIELGVLLFLGERRRKVLYGSVVMSVLTNVPLNLYAINVSDENNDVAERSYDDVFIQRYFDSYVTRESNKFNRTITDYLTGEDAMLESQLVEERIFDIESDMWEY